MILLVTDPSGRRYKFDICDQYGNILFIAFKASRLKWHVCDCNGNCIGAVKEDIWTWRRNYSMYFGGELIGTIEYESVFSWDKCFLEYQGWRVRKTSLWDYEVRDQVGQIIMTTSTQSTQKPATIWTIDVVYPEHMLFAVMIKIVINGHQRQS